MRDTKKRNDGQQEATAIISAGKSYTYKHLLMASQQVGSYLLMAEKDLNETRVAFMVSPSFEYVATQWGIWRAGGVAVPLCVTYPLPSLRYVIEDTQAQIVVASREFANLLAPLAAELQLRFVVLEDILEDFETLCLMPRLAASRRAMILYTSGTTNLPKGVVTTHANIEAQVTTLVKAWQWTSQDHILCVLPLHHVHGIINVVSCALWSGATVEF
ncbi:MAG: AMP-binding protein, partial [Spirosomaceae bacterium]|nr:AMP-binding protein [Spirosomataceae bacterium]